MKIIKSMKYKIIKPLNVEWKLFSSILNQIQHDSRLIMNKAIQLCWEYDGFSSEYKEKYNSYPTHKEILSYKDIRGYCYNKLKEINNINNTDNFGMSLKIAIDKWKNDKNGIYIGERSIVNFKKDIDIYIHNRSINIYKKNNEYILRLSLVSEEGLKKLNLDFKTGQIDILLGVYDNTQKSIIERVLSSEYKICASQIERKGKKVFLNLSYQFEKENTIQLDKNRIMGIDMGIKYPVYYSISDDNGDKFTPNRGHIKGGEIERFRKKVEKRRKELKEQGKYCGDGRIGHGIKTRIKPIEKIGNKITNFKDLTNHKYSRYIVEVAVKNKCGIIQMEDLKGINRYNKFLKNWSYYDLQTKIEYKAKEYGIEVIKIDPRYTSQRCSKCGYIDSDNRETQEKFICKNCEFTTNADYNASRNISIKNIDKIIKKQLDNQEKIKEKYELKVNLNAS